ncbi:hypothetical protein SCP_1000830 [Sparassis crispa]|uniref:Uncharacterized protein n=1 Tax=Sparassis crispa TaxID=139825 RepID=A0A401GX93_9APHY|nr:hypothetical protein SCP_1000830 [Sparassis crispa]GBE86841.1 hypothetical protein SCP_1000830 [Sparassis crispa]
MISAMSSSTQRDLHGYRTGACNASRMIRESLTIDIGRYERVNVEFPELLNACHPHNGHSDDLALERVDDNPWNDIITHRLLERLLETQ